MWLKFFVVSIDAAHGKPKSARLYLQHDFDGVPAELSAGRQTRQQEASLSSFCVPLGPELQKPKEVMAHEEYCFTLTQGDGTRVQGLCRRFLPPPPRVGSRLRYPQVLCIVCRASWSALFFKALEVVEQLLCQTDLLQDPGRQLLPADSYAGQFLSSLGEALAGVPPLGSVIRIKLPPVPTPLSVSPPKRVGGSPDSQLLAITAECIELQVPPDSGNGADNAGVSLARLLWHVPVPSMLTLIASLLLERRVLVVGQSRDMVSAAVCAAAALIHPFRWQHIYLPLLPASLKDYLTAPMPFLIGLPAQLLPSLRHIPMDEVTLVDLDLGSCEPAPGSPRDDAALLPWRGQLEGALHAAFGLLRSPTEHESNPLIASIMHGYFLKLLGGYRAHVYPLGCPPAGGAAALSASGGSGAPSPQAGGSSGAVGRSASASSLGSLGRGEPGRRAGAGAAAARDDSLQGHGLWLDHDGLAASHRRNERARCFLSQLRQSQMYEVFVRERLALEAGTPGGAECSADPFEQLVNTYLDNTSRRLSARLGAGVRSGLSRFTALVKKHRRTESAQHAPGGGGGFGLAGALGGLADGPQALRLQQLAAAFASAAAGGGGRMRRNLTEGSNLAALSAAAAAPAVQRPPPPQQYGHHPHHGHRHTVSAVDGLADQLDSALDPSAFFDDDEEDDEGSGGDDEGREPGGARSGFASRASSSSSLKDLASGLRGAGGGAGGARSPAGGGQPQQGGGSPHSRPLERRSVPVGSPAAEQQPPSPSPLIDLRGDDSPGSQKQQHQQHQHQQHQQLQQHHQHQQPPLPPQPQHHHQPRRASASNIGGLGVGSGGPAPWHLQPQQRVRAPAPVAPGGQAFSLGPLPQPPRAQGRAAASFSGAAQLQVQRHHLQPPPVPPLATTMAAGGPADPFAELLAERSATVSGASHDRPPLHLQPHSSGLGSSACSSAAGGASSSSGDSSSTLDPFALVGSSNASSNSGTALSSAGGAPGNPGGNGGAAAGLAAGEGCLALLLDVDGAAAPSGKQQPGAALAATGVGLVADSSCIGGGGIAGSAQPGAQALAVPGCIGGGLLDL